MWPDSIEFVFSSASEKKTVHSIKRQNSESLLHQEKLFFKMCYFDGQERVAPPRVWTTLLIKSFFLKLLKFEQSLLGFLVMWSELTFHLSVLLACAKKLKQVSDSYGFICDMEEKKLFWFVVGEEDRRNQPLNYSWHTFITALGCITSISSNIPWQEIWAVIWKHRLKPKSMVIVSTAEVECCNSIPGKVGLKQQPQHFILNFMFISCSYNFMVCLTWLMMMFHLCRWQNNNQSKWSFGQQPCSNASVSPVTEHSQLALSHYQYSTSVCSAKWLTALSDSISVTPQFKQHNWLTAVKLFELCKAQLSVVLIFWNL